MSLSQSLFNKKNSDKAITKLVDLVIPTFNRPEFLRRILDYYNSSSIKFNIIIVDSSLPKNKKKNKKIASFFSNLKISYFYNFSPKQPPHYKYGEMLKFVKAKYVCFCPDDDFLVPNGIKEAVNFLEQNPDYTTAHGSYISFYLQKSIFSLNKFWWRFIYPYQSIKFLSPLSRLQHHLTSYYQVLWAVRRTDIVKSCYKEFMKSKADPYLFGELLPDMLTLIAGKMKRLNKFYCARQAFSTSYSYWPSLMDARKNGIYDKEYLKFKNCLVENLVKCGFSKSKSLQTIDYSMDKYLKTTIQEHLTGRINLLLDHFPSFVKKSFRFAHIKYLFSKSNRDRIGLIDKPSSKFFNDFNAIRQIVLKHGM